jgi:hypothetical protein
MPTVMPGKFPGHVFLTERPLAAEYERARQSAEQLRQALQDCGAGRLARLVRAVGCSVEFMPLLEEEAALLHDLVAPRRETGIMAKRLAA